MTILSCSFVFPLCGETFHSLPTVTPGVLEDPCCASLGISSTLGSHISGDAAKCDGASGGNGGGYFCETNCGVCLRGV